MTVSIQIQICYLLTTAGKISLTHRRVKPCWACAPGLVSSSQVRSDLDPVFTTTLVKAQCLFKESQSKQLSSDSLIQHFVSACIQAAQRNDPENWVIWSWRTFWATFWLASWEVTWVLCSWNKLISGAYWKAVCGLGGRMRSWEICSWSTLSRGSPLAAASIPATMNSDTKIAMDGFDQSRKGIYIWDTSTCWGSIILKSSTKSAPMLVS